MSNVKKKKILLPIMQKGAVITEHAILHHVSLYFLLLLLYISIKQHYDSYLRQNSSFIILKMSRMY